jgi:glutamine amidotransferase/cyclase
MKFISFRKCRLLDMPMMEMLKHNRETVFVSLTVCSGIKDVVDPDGKSHPAHQGRRRVIPK